METAADLQKVDDQINDPLLKIGRNSWTASDTEAESEIEDVPRYTSLKDVMLCSSSRSQEGINEFDTSQIFIRNQLVKSAASAYLQSAQILANKNENCFFNLWGKLKNNVASNGTSFSCCNVYFRDPLKACFGAVYQFVACNIVGVALGRIFRCQRATTLHY